MKKKRIGFIIVILILLGMISWYSLKQLKMKNTTTENSISVEGDITKIELTDSITITSPGTYELTGTIADGSIKVNTKGIVILILNNVTITNSTGPAIYIENSKETTIQLKDGSINKLTDGISYNNFDEDVNGAIFSNDNLIMNGTGSLTVTANYEDGIVSKDNLTIESGILDINAKDDAIRGRDTVTIKDGTITINCLGNGIKTTNDTDTSLGYIKIEKGTFYITSTLDGIQAITSLTIEDGTFNIKTGSGSSTTWNNQTTSSKGLKAGTKIEIKKGTFTIDTMDDAIHSNNIITIEDGTFTISSGDDGIHADDSITISNGTITIAKSYEGIEAMEITINGGTINITASDDGINAAGGNDASTTGRPGSNSFASTGSGKLVISGGVIVVNSSGDGLDANGSIYIKGGEIYVNGPTSDGDGALDYDNEFMITSGTLMAIGSSGMAENATSSSTQPSVILFTTIASGDKITLTDENGTILLEYTAQKQAGSIVYSSSSLKLNQTYRLNINGTVTKTFTMTSTLISVGQKTTGPRR